TPGRAPYEHEVVKRWTAAIAVAPFEAEFVLGSAVPHDRDLILGSHSVHTSTEWEPKIRSRSCGTADRKSTRLNSSHRTNSYAVSRTPSSFPTRRSSDLHARPRAVRA